MVSSCLDGKKSSKPSDASPRSDDENAFINLSTFQRASVVLGQIDFTSNVLPPSADASSFSNIWGNPLIYQNRLYIAGYADNRILVYDAVPSLSNTDASFVLGQGDFSSTNRGTNDDNFDVVQNLLVKDGKFFAGDYGNHRILIYNTIPTAPGAKADIVVGWPDFNTPQSGCARNRLSWPEAYCVANGKLVVADSGNNRVLIWNTIPTSSGALPDIVIGQPDFDTCTAPLSITSLNFEYPAGAWCDDSRLAIVDQSRNRVLIWNTFPTSAASIPDVVLGQALTTTGASGLSDKDLSGPYYIASNGIQLFLADTGNNRVLVWDSFPENSYTPADKVLGQGDFFHNTSNDDDVDGVSDAGPTARTLSQSGGLYVGHNRLIVPDASNYRVLIYEGQ